ncbi:hypothetical protein JAAARDRAFT_195093 [Jaapia argillacea MUCL 33604]|uniref:Neutral ceramidase n=1 Tax=Jaapia argillacea MUCL 33604 TaxID=933084 RepID=A0A067PNT2_9AGAM|nr:hypothetical protein JAAARDRAFT_195093 [Jaapia argillacea MUCL 33604]
MPAIYPTTLLPSELLNLTASLLEWVGTLVWGFTALLASASVWQNGPSGGAEVQVAPGLYLIGLGIGDITGPVVETNMMGYASRNQTDTGLHMRERSRAWIVADPTDPTNRVVFINADIAMGDTGIRRSIVSNLSSQYPGLYTNDNIALSSTHQHSGVGGYLENLLPQITSLGYVKQTADAIVAGTVLAVQRAHDSLALGKLSFGNVAVLNGNINRSPSAYLANPVEERERYEWDVDKELSLLKFEDEEGNGRGFLSFFPVHGTSLYNNNTLISGDNKGMAAYLYENMAEPSTMPGNTTFVAGFAQSNVGDTSPNTSVPLPLSPSPRSLPSTHISSLGAFCESPGQPYDGQPCDFYTSTCGNRTEDCHGRGPGFMISYFESNRIIAQYQVEGAMELMGQTLQGVQGGVKSVHVNMYMPFRNFTLPNGTVVQTCPAALGYSFAGGTSDGPGAFDFTQGKNSSQPLNPFWEIVKGAITPYPPPEQVACQYPKPVLLDTGYAHTPYEWAPSTVDIQMLRIGNFVILVMPGELTTMAGRRMRDAIRTKLISSGVLGDDAYVVIAGPANTYAHYVTTREEYAVQRYEGASTLFGPYPPPPEQTSKAISLQTAVIADNPPFGKHFGDVLVDVQSSAYHADDTVYANFVGANPRNNLRLEDTFLTVDCLVNDTWVTVRSDSHPSTVYQWARTSTVLGTSTVNISWVIEPSTPSGVYRLMYYGDAKSLMRSISAFEGTSSNFTVS